MALLFPKKSFSANDVYFSRIGVEHGLSQLTVMKMYQDELGGMWFATREGLNRYNGSSMEVFRPIPNDSNSLGESLILYVCGDKSGHVFIHTQNGVNEYDLRSSKMKLIRKSSIDAISYGKNNLWIAEKNKIYAYKNGELTLFCELPSNMSIRKIYQTKDERILLGTLSLGVFVIDKTKKIRSFLPACSRVSDILEDSKQNIWITTWQKGLYKIEKNGNVINYKQKNDFFNNCISSNFVRSVCEDNNGFIWIGTTNGLDRLDVSKDEFKHYGSGAYSFKELSNESVWALLKDDQGTISKQHYQKLN